MCTDIDIIDDEAVENYEYFYVELSTNDSNVQLLRYYQRRGFCYRIYDNDGKIDYGSCMHVQETVANVSTRT